MSRCWSKRLAIGTDEKRVVKQTTLKMDQQALTTLLHAEFPQLAQQFAIDALAPMQATVRLLNDDQHLRPGGTVSGPAMFALADVSVYLAIMAMIGPATLSVTTQGSIDFLRKPAAGVDLICRTRLLKLGRILAVGDCRIQAQDQDDILARASLTYAISPSFAR